VKSQSLLFFYLPSKYISKDAQESGLYMSLILILHKIVSYDLVATFSVKNSYIFSYLVEAFLPTHNITHQRQ
jgi:hypothetical protein